MYSAFNSFCWQGVTSDVKIEVFAKQHRNTSGLGSEWVNIVEKN